METEPKSEGTPPPYGKFHIFFFFLFEPFPYLDYIPYQTFLDNCQKYRGQGAKGLDY